MARITAGAAALAVALLLVSPATATTTAPLAPAGDQDNALGTIRWLPTNANEKPTGANVSRLVVVHDVSLDAQGNAVPLKGKGPFGVKFFTSSPDPRMVGHSPSVSSLDDLTGQQQIGPVDQAFMGVSGDVRKGDCSKVGTPDFSRAYSTTRSFLHPGADPYDPVTAPGTCEVVDSSVAVTDNEGNLLGYQTTVSNHVPGFWIDVLWAKRALPGLTGNGYMMAELWYGALYDTEGQDGEWYTTVDANTLSTSVGGPGDYTGLYSFTATPGGAGPACTEWEGVPDQAGTWADVKVQVPESATRVTFQLYPKADWDVIVIDPNGTKGIAGNWTTLSETLIVPASGTNNIPELVPGEFTFRACNFSGETTVLGSVIIE